MAICVLQIDFKMLAPEIFILRHPEKFSSKMLMDSFLQTAVFYENTRGQEKDSYIFLKIFHDIHALQSKPHDQLLEKGSKNKWE